MGLFRLVARFLSLVSSMVTSGKGTWGSIWRRVKAFCSMLGHNTRTTKVIKPLAPQQVAHEALYAILNVMGGILEASSLLTDFERSGVGTLEMRVQLSFQFQSMHEALPPQLSCCGSGCRVRRPDQTLQAERCHQLLCGPPRMSATKNVSAPYCLQCARCCNLDEPILLLD